MKIAKRNAITILGVATVTCVMVLFQNCSSGGGGSSAGTPANPNLPHDQSNHGPASGQLVLTPSGHTVLGLFGTLSQTKTLANGWQVSGGFGE